MYDSPFSAEYGTTLQWFAGFDDSRGAKSHGTPYDECTQGGLRHSGADPLVYFDMELVC